MSQDYKNFLLDKISEYFEDEYEIDEELGLSRQATLKLDLKFSESGSELNNKKAHKKPHEELAENYANLRYKIDFKKECIKQKIEDYFNKLIDQSNKIEKLSAQNLVNCGRSTEAEIDKLINLPKQFESKIENIRSNINVEEILGRVEFEPIKGFQATSFNNLIKNSKIPYLNSKNNRPINKSHDKLLDTRQVKNGKLRFKSGTELTTFKNESIHL
ncbi:unnamed protein product [Brachionus calyciflorus]|uniref:Uncharacterized protein n=1 Tax=Brachionus calyciflorus TaxID=104777 RepID=A0A813QB56_9BILA|nr:unnamed protein product [Brachionus calyciflorus]